MWEHATLYVSQGPTINKIELHASDGVSVVDHENAGFRRVMTALDELARQDYEVIAVNQISPVGGVLLWTYLLRRQRR